MHAPTPAFDYGHDHRPDERPEAVPLRWECPCHVPPVLLGTYTADGTVILKARDRYWRVRRGAVEATCPRCGAVRRLEPPAESASRQVGESASRQGPTMETVVDSR